MSALCITVSMPITNMDGAFSRKYFDFGLRNELNPFGVISSEFGLFQMWIWSAEWGTVR